MEYKYIEKTEVESLIKSVSKRSKAVALDIHKAALSAAKHADEHGDVTLAQRLVAEVHKSVRVKGLIAWFCAVGPFRVPTEEERKAGVTEKLVHAKGKTFLEAEAWATPFYDFTEEKEPVALQGWAAFDKLLGQLEKAANAGNLKGMDLTAISKIKAAAAGIRPVEV